VERESEVQALGSVLNQKFGGLEIDSMIADSPDFGEDWRWVDALLGSAESLVVA